LQELKICAAIIDIFHLIPAASQKMLEPLTVTVLKGEKDLYIEVITYWCYGRIIYWCCQLASCLNNAQPLLAHSPDADDNSLIGCTSHDLTDDWSLASAHFVNSLYPFRCSFGCVLLLNQIYLTTMYRATIPLRFIWLICSGNYG